MAELSTTNATAIMNVSDSISSGSFRRNCGRMIAMEAATGMSGTSGVLLSSVRRLSAIDADPISVPARDHSPGADSEIAIPMAKADVSSHQRGVRRVLRIRARIPSAPARGTEMPSCIHPPMMATGIAASSIFAGGSFLFRPQSVRKKMKSNIAAIDVA